MIYRGNAIANVLEHTRQQQELTAFVDRMKCEVAIEQGPLYELATAAHDRLSRLGSAELSQEVEILYRAVTDRSLLTRNEQRQASSFLTALRLASLRDRFEGRHSETDRVPLGARVNLVARIRQ